MPTISGVRLAVERDAIREQARAAGWVLVRDLPFTDRAGAAEAIRELLAEPMTEREGFAPRTDLGGGVHTDVEWPADQPLCMHNELSYADQPPGLLVFACVTPPSSGGATALADTRAVLADLPDAVRDRFTAAGWQLLRNYTGLVGTHWPEAFGTDDPAAATAYCAAHGIDAVWGDEGWLRTTQRRPAVVTHPGTGESCWFNQIAFLNEHTMVPEFREYLVSQLGPDGLPFTTVDSHGEPLDKSTVDKINAVYDRHTVREPWRQGDLLVVDNILTAHSREPYRGPRDILVGLGDPVTPAP